MARYVVRIARHAVVVALLVVAAILGAVSGVLFAYGGDLPEIARLDDYAPETITRVQASDGTVIGEFAIQRRVVIGHDDISPTLRQAIIAAEDAEFDSHFGLSIPRIIVTAVRDITQGRRVGASTITQQLARHLFLQEYQRGGGAFEVSLERKIKEAIVAIQIEKRYTKREILTLYCNQMYLGSGAYGVEAAARLYFGKSAGDLSVPEAALIAGLFQSPSRQSPFINVERARARRSYVLQRMADEGYLTQAEAEAAKDAPIELQDPPSDADSLAPYFVEEVRKHVETRYGATQLYEGGLVVRTSLDPRLQQAANAAVDRGLRALDRRRGFRRPVRNVLDEGRDLETFDLPIWLRTLAGDQVVPAVVTGSADGRIQFRIGRFRGEIERDGFAWTRRSAPDQLVRPGDLIDVRIGTIDGAAGVVTGTLEQEPIVEGALLALDNRTGQVRAMVGGYSFERSKFNRATQALRQLGSAFKPIVFTAAIDRGYTPTAILDDTPVSYDVGPGQPLYQPLNYDRRFEGPITLRRVLEQSRNVPTVRVAHDLTPEQIVSYARRLGFVSPLPPVLSLALGAAEASLVEVTGAYAAFANQGVRMQPYYVLHVADREGNVLEENRPEPRDAIRADTAFVMANLLRGVVVRGTAARAAALDWPLAGKTGTTDEYTDAWFVGFDPDITVGVWVGHDLKRTLGPAETGSAAALPIWIDFMRAYIDELEEAPDFRPPGNIVFLTVDRTTGRRVDPATPGAIAEAFISGTQPGTAFYP